MRRCSVVFFYQNSKTTLALFFVDVTIWIFVCTGEHLSKIPEYWQE